MTIHHRLAWLPLMTLLAMLLAGPLRAIIVDLRRPLGEQLYDTLMIGVVIVWFYLLVGRLGRCRWVGYSAGSPRR